MLVEVLTAADYSRIAELIEGYADFPMGGTDASLVAIAERLHPILFGRSPGASGRSPHGAEGDGGDPVTEFDDRLAGMEDHSSGEPVADLVSQPGEVSGVGR